MDMLESRSTSITVRSSLFLIKFYTVEINLACDLFKCGLVNICSYHLSLETFSDDIYRIP